MTRRDQEYAARWGAIEAQAREQLLQAVQEGQRLASEIQEKAREEARKNLDRARESLQLEVTQARITLRKEMVGLAILAAERIISERLDEPRQRELVTRFMDQLEHVR